MPFSPVTSCIYRPTLPSIALSNKILLLTYYFQRTLTAASAPNTEPTHPSNLHQRPAPPNVQPIAALLLLRLRTPSPTTLLPIPLDIDNPFLLPSGNVRDRCLPTGCKSPVVPHTKNNPNTPRIESYPLPP